MTLTRGFLILDKPEGLSSAALVAKVRWRFGRKLKVGHAGTLDPQASGILPLALGEATKAISYIATDTKTYTFELMWGEARTTDDMEGEVVETSPVRPTPTQIEAALEHFTGDYDQIPPIYSAIFVEGKRAYALARAGVAPELAARRVHVSCLRLVKTQGDVSTLEVTCGAGFYVRSLARDLAKHLGSCGHARHIRRTQVGPFTEKDALSIEKLEILPQIDLIREYVRSLECVLDDIPALSFADSDEKKLMAGQALCVTKALGERGIDPCADAQEVVCKSDSGLIFALATLAGGVVKPRRILMY
ncbi:MAG: tRNA pseudouridine(55) synthase TruB [Candidatus Puniceispirillum sp.]|nr:tRNA pseudouridine(55) synthase TruB [Candidatus Puniceispirillum sp.]